MDTAIERTAMSIIMREQHDFGMSLVDHRGWVVAGTPFAGQTLAEYAAAHLVGPGDVMMFNDPYLSHGEISHLGDTMLAVPIFWDGRLIAWGHHVTTPPVETGGAAWWQSPWFQQGLLVLRIRHPVTL